MKPLLLVSFAATAVFADMKISVESQRPSPGITLYSYKIEGAPVNATVNLHLAIDPKYAAPQEGSNMEPTKIAIAGCASPCYTGTAKADSPLQLNIQAPNKETKEGKIKWTIGGEGGTVEGPVTAVEGPVTASADSTNTSEDPFFNVMIGAGTLLTTRNATDYQVLQNTSTLAATGIGRNHLDLLLGGAFTILPKHPWIGYISLKFTPGSTDTINGFVFGGGYRLKGGRLAIIGGVGLTPKNEPAIGLRRVAYNVVSQNANDPTYTGFIAQDLLLNRGQAPFDGFPLQRDGKPIYQGSPLEKHYRTGAFVGVAFTFNIFQQIGGKGSSTN